MKRAIRIILLAITALLAVSMAVDVVAEPVQRLQVNVVPRLQAAFDLLMKSPKARALYERVSQEGPIQISEYEGNSDLAAFWYGDERRIVINTRPARSVGSMATSILIELHNATTAKRLSDLTSQAVAGTISKERFVELVERMEHANALSTSRIIEEGIRSGLFPADARYLIYENFDDHYRVQQLAGHSQWLADHYNRLNVAGIAQPYRGTVPGLPFLSSQDREDALRYLSMKQGLQMAVDEASKAWYKRKIAEEERSLQKRRLFDLIF